METRNDPPNVQEWNADPDYANLGGDGFFGGDLKGILDHFDHLLELGVDAIYLNPIFESPSSHKYDTEDYLKIDDNFGDDQLFEELLTAANDSDVKIILDGCLITLDTTFRLQGSKKRGEESPLR